MAYNNNYNGNNNGGYQQNNYQQNGNRNYQQGNQNGNGGYRQQNGNRQGGQQGGQQNNYDKVENWGLKCFSVKPLKDNKGIYLDCAKNGKRKENGEYGKSMSVRVFCFYDRCQMNAANYDGAYVSVSGTFALDEYTRQDGSTVPSPKIYASSIRVIERNGNGNGGGQNNYQNGGNRQQNGNYQQNGGNNGYNNNGYNNGNGGYNNNGYNNGYNG